MNSKHENFTRISNKRITKIVASIDSLQNFSNGSFYSYSKKELSLMLEAIQNSLDNTRAVLEEHIAKENE